MIHLALILTAAVTGGLLYRLRGWGRFMAGTFRRRLVWSLSTGLFSALLTSAWPVGSAVAAGCYLGLLIPHGQYYAIGMKTPRDGGRHPMKNLAMMSLIGMIRATLYALPLVMHTKSAPALIVLGALQGPAYYGGYRLSGFYRQEGVFWGEVLTGACIWAGLALVLGG